MSGNARCDGYLALKDMLESGWLKINCKQTARQIEYMKVTYNPKSTKIYIIDKKEIRKERNESPDYSDALMMGIYGIYYHNRFFFNNRNIVTNMSMNGDFDPFQD